MGIRAPIKDYPIQGKIVMRIVSAFLFFLLFCHMASAMAGEIWLGGNFSNSVGVFDEETLAPIDEISVEQGAADVDFSPDGNTAFVVPTTFSNPNDVLVVDVETRQIIDSIDVGGIADLQIERRPNSANLYVGNCFNTSQLFIIDGETATADDLDPLEDGLQGIAIPSDGTPWKMDFSPDGHFAYATKCGGTAGGQIFKIDLEQNVAVSTIPVTPTTANSVDVSDDGTLAIVAGGGSAETSIIDLTTDTEVGVHEYDSGRNDGVALFKAQQKGYVLNFDFFSGEAKLLELDISDPTDPFLTTETLLNDPLQPGSTRGQSLRRIGSLLYATLSHVGGTAESQVVLIDVSTALPVILTRMSFGSSAFSQVVRRPDLSSPTEQVAALMSDIAELDLQPGISNSLDQRLEAAVRLLNDENPRNDVAAIRSLESLIHTLEAQRDRRLTDAQADALIAAAESTIAAISNQ